MVNKKITIMANNSTNDGNAMAEMRVAMDDLCRHNQTFEDNVLHIQ